jgi:hypothetical protein
MASNLSITYYASHELLGIASDEEYRRFKDQLQEAFEQEWPDAVISIGDDEEPYFEIEGVSGQAEQDVQLRAQDIVDDIIETGLWRDEEEDFYDEEEEIDDEEDDEDFR